MWIKKVKIPKGSGGLEACFIFGIAYERPYPFLSFHSLIFLWFEKGMPFLLCWQNQDSNLRPSALMENGIHCLPSSYTNDVIDL